MRLRKRKRSDESAWRAVRRCVVFFTTICVIPVLLVLIVTTDSYMRPVKQTSFLRPQFDHMEANLLNALHNLSAVGRRLEKRRIHLKKACKLLGLNVPGNDSLHRPNPWEFLVDNRHHLVWCNVFKAASTSWMYNFNILAGYSPKFLKKSKLVPLSLARQKYPRPTLLALQKAFNNSVSFLITRHPLERLLSAYRDKLQFALPHTHHRKLGNEIIVKYRRKTNQKSKTIEKWPTFPEFVMYLLDCVKQGQTLDMHWTPITEFCTPCMFNFDIIAHTETLQEDQQFLIKKARLEGLVEPQWRNAGHGTTAKQIRKYYSQLTRSQILQLYHIYRYDFELFNYSLKGYLELGMPDEDPNALLAAITLKDFPQDKDHPMPQLY